MIQFNSNKRYNNYTAFIREVFGERVQKISLNTGFTCPNRDGSKGVGGCTYCNNHTFSPNYTKASKSIKQQLDEGISFFSKKYKAQKYLAYFQSYTNTYADYDLVKTLYTTAINHKDVLGIVIGTRPDCINEDIINFLSEIAKTHFVSLEFGVESTLDKTLNEINRCHTYQETIEAYQLAQNKGFHLGAHLIMGLPGESRSDIMAHAKTISNLPIETLKLHHLQIVKHTMMAIQYKKDPNKFELFSAEEYIDFITDFISFLRPDIIIERFISESPKNLLVAPNWNGLKNFEIVDKIDKKLIEKDLWQGKFYK